MVGLEDDVAVRFRIAKEMGATAVVNGSTEDVVARCQEICGKDNLTGHRMFRVPILP